MTVNNDLTAFFEYVRSLFEEDFEVKTGPHQRDPFFESYYDVKLPKKMRHAQAISKAWCKENTKKVSSLLEMDSGFHFLNGHILYERPNVDEALKLLEDVADRKSVV